MKPELQRIETTLHQLEESSPSGSQPTSTAESAEDCLEWPSQETDGSPSFSMTVPPIPARKHAGKTPVLPKLKPPSFSNHRNGANPGLAMILLQEIEEVVGGWQKELQQVVRQIQDIYLEGPIVDGWLESHSREPEVGIGMLRHVEADRLMNYVEVETGNFVSSQGQADATVTCQAPQAGYRLCGLDADGQSWSRPCPPEQVPSVSMAIARYQKLRQLLSHKQELETRLTQLAETLVVLHSHLSGS